MITYNVHVDEITVSEELLLAAKGLAKRQDNYFENGIN